MNVTLQGKYWKPVYIWNYDLRRWLQKMWQRPNGGITGCFKESKR